jgi:hypothetical protein
MTLTEAYKITGKKPLWVIRDLYHNLSYGKLSDDKEKLKEACYIILYKS